MLCWNQTLFIFHKRAHNKKLGTWYRINSLFNLTTFTSFLQHATYLKEITLCSVKSVLTGALPSILDLTASEYPVTREVNFYFHPSISDQSVYDIQYLGPCYSLTDIAGGSTLYFYNHNTSVKQCMWNTTTVYTSLPQNSSHKHTFPSMKSVTSQCTVNNTEPQTEAALGVRQA